jgi:PAP2 superfamily
MTEIAPNHWPPPSTYKYSLPGSQVEPEASYWTEGQCYIPHVVPVRDLLKITDQEEIDDHPNPFFFPNYPSNKDTTKEIEELHELATLRDDPAALVSHQPGRKRNAISPFLQLVPQPLGAVFNIHRPPDQPVIRTGRELARWFEHETPGLGHRQALNYLIQGTNWSPPRQTLAWMSLDLAIHSAALAAWHYKWASLRQRVSYRPRPIEFDPSISVLFNRAVNVSGSADGERHLFPQPSPGTPRHPSYPSGHSTIAGAASEILSYFFPDYIAEFDALADNAGMGRMWAGIHYRSDHETGVRLGRTVAREIVKQLQSGCTALSLTTQVDAKSNPSSQEELFIPVKSQPKELTSKPTVEQEDSRKTHIEPPGEIALDLSASTSTGSTKNNEIAQGENLDTAHYLSSNWDQL